MLLMRRSLRVAGLVALLGMGPGPAIGSDAQGAPRISKPPAAVPRAPNAQPEALERLRREATAVPSRQDGGGRGWIERRDSTERATAGQAGRWVILYEAGELGIQEGGALFLLVPPFLGWSPPQLKDATAPGHVIVSTTARGVALRPRIPREMLLQIKVQGRALAAGERVRIVYGAGPAGALADQSAERDSRFWMYVDGDGDGVYRFLPDSPAIDVGPGPPSRLQLVWPGVARPGDTVPLRLAVLDARANPGAALSGVFELSLRPRLEGPERVTLTTADAGQKQVSLAVREEGVHRVSARGPRGLAAESNPLVVSASLPRILWADLHGHSNLSDGTGTPEDFFRYAREVAGLDVVALTDHDHWGAPRFLDENLEVWQAVGSAARRFDLPGRFVALRGYEWTSWLYGHRHVLFFADDGEVKSSIDPAYETPPQLWSALRGGSVVTIGHHPAGRPIAIDWDLAPDAELEPLVEIVSNGGSSEAWDTPFRIREPAPRGFVRRALRKGHRLGFVGSSDSHDGHPGCPEGPPARSCGLAGILAEQRTRSSVLEALRARRVYATNGPRILLWATLDEAPMGSTLTPAARRVLRVRVVAAAPLERLDLVRDGAVVERVPGHSRPELLLERVVDDLRSGETLYVRVLQEDQGAAWSSPFFVE